MATLAVSSKLGGDLQVGEYVEFEHRAWRVGLVNFTRARLDPMRLTNAESATKRSNSDIYAGCVNIGPASTLRRLTPEQAASFGQAPVAAGPSNRQPVATGSTQESDTMAAEVAGTPIPARKDRVKISKARKATGSKATASKPRKVAATREPKVADKPCKCGCGEKTASHFVAGHDARFKGWLLAIERGKVKKEDVLKKAVIGAYTWKKKGNGEIPTLNYKGEKHNGYESTSEA